MADDLSHLRTIAPARRAENAPRYQPEDRTGKTFRDAALSYLEDGGEGKYLGRLIDYFGDTPMSMIVPHDVQQAAKILQPGHKNSTRNRQVNTPIRAVFNHAYDKGWCNLIRLKNFKEDPPKRKEPATALWMHLFIRQCEKDDLHHVAALILFMSQTAARVSEAVDLRWPEVDFAARTALLLKTKTETNSERYLTDELVYRMQQLRMKTNDLQGRVFRFKCRYSVNERIKAVCKRADIKYKPSHECGRHTYATTAIELGIDIPTAMAGGGWKSSTVFLGTYVRPRRNAGRMVADRFNQYQFERNV